MNNKIIIGIAIAALLAVAVLLKYKNSAEPSNTTVSQNTSSASVEEAPRSVDVAKIQSEATNSQSAGSSTAGLNRELQPNETRVLANEQEWKAAHPNFRKEGNEAADYDYYDAATLKQLSESGDLYARSRYANYLAGKGLIEEAVPLFESLAAHGSTEATQIAANMFVQKYINGKDVDRSVFQEGLAWYLATDLRGDPGGRMGLDRSIASNALTVAPEDRRIACLRSRELMGEWSDERTRLGLNQFDNSAPPVPNYTPGSFCSSIE